MKKREGGIVDKGFNVFNHVFFVMVSIIMLYPFWYVLMFSISDPSKSALNSYYLLPQGFTLDTYRYMLKQTLIYTGYKNTIFVTVVGTAFSLFMTFITAYPLSQGKLKGKNIILKFIFFTMLFDGGMIPTYIVVRGLGLTNSLWSLIILGCINVFYLLIMIKFFKGIPSSLIESAKIDGYNDIGILFKIVLPLSGAALSSIALFYAVGHWNAFLGPIIYINDNDKMVLQVVLRSLFKQDTLGNETNISMQISSPEHFRMATIIITILPIVMAYPFIQKYFVKGVTLGSVKG